MKKTFLSLVIFLLLMLIFYERELIGHYLSFERLKVERNNLELLFSLYPWRFALSYLLIYITTTALSLPGATILTLAGGAIFGLLEGTILVSFASTIGATIAFYVSRYLLRDLVNKRFKNTFDKIDRGIHKEGGFYLFSLRLIPIFPFFMINLLMGLTNISGIKFFFISQIGMLAGTMVYVNAGTQLASLQSAQDIFTIKMIGAFSLIGIFPLLSKKLLELFRPSIFKTPKHYDYNLLVIGAGSAGLVSAYIASAVKASVAIIEKAKMGGDCLNTGCVPSKAIIYQAKRAYHSNNGKPDFNVTMKKVKDSIEKIAPHDSIERYQKLGVDCLQGHAKLISPYEVKVNDRIISARNIIIATGATPKIVHIQGLESIDYLTSDNIWNLAELPKKLVVLGGGPIACELAQAFNRLGSAVTIIQRGSKLMPKEDAEVGEWIKHCFEREKIRVITDSTIELIEGDNKYIQVKTIDATQKIYFDKILLAYGRSANTQGLGVEELGIDLNTDGTIKVDEYLRTSIPNIFACGDVAGPYQYTHTASHQAWYATVNSLFGFIKKFKTDYRVIPHCTFTDPEVARVGINEQEAISQGMCYQVTKYELAELDRAITEEQNSGWIKILTYKNSDKILGVTIVGAHAGEMIVEYILAMKHKLGLNKILSTIHIYPTYSEGNKMAAGQWKRSHAPQKILSMLELIHRWRR